jgi:hypothetical protein
MPFPTNIQFYIDEHILTRAQAEALSELETNALNTPFARGSILQGFENIRIHISDRNSSRVVQVYSHAEAVRELLELRPPERVESMKFFIGVQAAIDEGMLSMRQAISMPIEKKFFLTSPLFRSLIALGELGFDPGSGLTLEQRPMDIEYLIPFYSKVLALQTHIEQSEHAQALIQTINLQKLFCFFLHGELVDNGALTIDEFIGLTQAQFEGLRQFVKIVLEGSLYARPRDVRGLNRGISLQECTEKTQQIYHQIHDMLERDIISKETLLNFPRVEHLGRYLCSLIINGKISITEIQSLTGRQKSFLEDANVHDLIMSDIATISQIYRLTPGQLYQLCQPDVYNRVAAGTLDLENIPEETHRVNFSSFFTRTNSEESDGETEENNPNFSMEQ